MNFRSRDDIFLPEHHYLFDYEEVAEDCEYKAYDATRPTQVVEWVKSEENPFIREYKAGLAYEYYRERVKAHHLPVTYDQMADFDSAIERIVRDSRVEETVYLWKRADGEAVAGEPAPSLTQRQEASEAVGRNLEQLREDLDQMKAEIAQLRKQMEEAAVQAPVPGKGRFTDLCAWLEQEKSQGRDWLAEAGGNTTQMCRNLSERLDWEVNANSLRKAQNRR